MNNLKSDEYKTIKAPAEGFFKDKASKFYSFAFPVETETEIDAHLKELRKRFFDARHHCYAWRLGSDKKNFRANDNGEPANSAGAPILGQIRSFDLTNILIVNVRYFGGTLLGVGGLINANKTAAAEAIKASEIIIKTVKQELEITFNYLVMNHVMKIIKEEDLKPENQTFDNVCKMQLYIRSSDFERVTQRFSKIENVNVQV
jgi:uncharacterized YigZ family protein